MILVLRTPSWMSGNIGLIGDLTGICLTELGCLRRDPDLPPRFLPPLVEFGHQKHESGITNEVAHMVYDPLTTRAFRYVGAGVSTKTRPPEGYQRNAS